MPLKRGEVHGYNIDRMVVEFTLLNQGKVILCAISTAATRGMSAWKAGTLWGRLAGRASRIF